MSRVRVLFSTMFALTMLSATALAQQSWDTTINNSTRFKVLGDFANAAVIDNETGLVWERSPAQILASSSDSCDTTSNVTSWDMAFLCCIKRNVGGRMGWRLPTVWELSTLLDMT